MMAAGQTVGQKWARDGAGVVWIRGFGTNRRKEGRKGGRKEERKKKERKKGRKKERKKGRKEERKKGRKEERKKGSCVMLVSK